jgi:Ca-activated chloride channel family protein
MIFAHPWWLLAGLLACGAVLWVWRRYDARQRLALEQFVAPHLRGQLTQSISGVRIIVKRVLFATSIALLFVAIAGPQAGYQWEQVKRRGNDIIFAVDTSRSMLTPDVKPNRLARAKLAIDDFVNHLNGDAVGLVAFAGSAFLQTPITLDYGAFRESLNALDTNIIPRPGTNITSAIQEAQAALQHRPGSDKVLILVTDGEDLEGDSLTAAKAAATQDGLKIFTVGVGSANGDLIPLPADQGGGFLKDSEGHLVKSHLDESALKALAAAAGGSYAPLGAKNQGLDAIYQEALAPLAKHDLDSRAQKVYTERFQWPLCAAFALLLGSLMVGTRRRVSSKQPTTKQPTTIDSRSVNRFALPTAAALLGFCWLVPIHSAHASAASAATAYQHGDFSAAEHDYSAAAQRNPKQPVLQFNAGAAAYKAGQFPIAAQAFQASVNVSKSGDAKRLAEQQDAYYNLGNTLYREGQKTEQANAEQTVQSWTQAVKDYDAALQLRADDADSKFNRDLVNRKLEALKKAQSQKNQPKQSSQSPSQAQPKPQQGQGQQSPENSSPSKPQQQAGQPKQQGSGQPQQAKGQPQPGKGQRDQSNGQPQQAQQNSGSNPPNKGQTNPDPSQPPGPKNEPSAAANGSSQKPDRGQDQGNADSRSEQTAQAGDDQRQPGEMSRQEARELLDSVKDEERRAPSTPIARNGGEPSASDEPLKDW